MGAVAEVVSDVFEPIGEAVGQVEKAIESAASEVGHVVEEVGQQVGKTVEAMAKDPAKALPLIAVAVLAPELAPLLWEGATAAEAAMVLNTGMQLANGADPLTVATNLATSAATMGVTQGLDISTGYNPVDRAIGSAASAALQGGDVNKAIGSSIGNQLIGGAIGAGTSAAKNIDFSGADTTEKGPAQSYSDLSREMTADNTQSNISNDTITTSQTFRDAIYNGFSPEEAYAIAQGQADAQASGTSPYAPTAGVTTSDQPDATVKVEAAPEGIQGTGTTLPQQTKEELDQDLADGKITQEEYDRAIPTAAIETKAESEYIDPQGALDTLAPTEDTTPKETSPTDDALNTTTDTKGNLLYTYDDGSTLTLSPDGEVVDVTEATDTGEYTDQYQEEEDTTGKSGSGFALKLGSGNKGRISGAGLARRGIAKSPTPTGTSGATGGLDTLGGEQYGVGLTASTAKGNPQYSLMGEEPTEEPQGFATGGSAATQGVYDLSSTASSPFLGGGNSDIMALKPTMVKGKINYALPGYPFGQEWKAAKEGGHMVDDHNPTFFSEGGLGKMKNTYVKGDGDGTSDSIAAMLADGEFVIPADVVSNLGNGSNDAGAKVLNEFLRTIRAHKRKADPKGLPPDSKGALGYLAAAKKKVKK
jgi:hypothetical protein